VSVVLSEHLPLLATAPGGIQKLRDLILELAVRGKLVPQNCNDEPASELLQRIARERSRLEVEGVCKKSKPMPPVLEYERPFEIPNSWAWTRWNDIAQKIGDIDHKMPETTKEGVPYVSPRDFYPNNSIDFRGAKKISRDDFLRLSAKIRPEVGDIIYPRYGTIGENRLVVDDLEFLASYSCCVIKTLTGFVAPRFQFYFSISQCCRDQAKAAENKTTQANVGIKSIQEFAIPLPPLAEQHRIAAKVDELMALCDRLEAEQADVDAAHARLIDILLAALTQSTNAADFATSWQRLAEHFDTLFTTESSLDALKQTVLQLAVMGKLVPQNLDDEPSGELLMRIAQERSGLEAKGICKKLSPMPAVEEDEQPFPVPDGWQWKRLDELLSISGGVTLGRKLFGRELVSRPYLRVANVQRGYLMLDQMKVIEVPIDEQDKYRLQAEDLLITEGGDWDKVGRTAIWRDEVKDCLHQNHVFRARPLSREWNSRWTEMYLNATPARAYFAASSKQTTNLASINMTQLKTCPFPVPPLAEQRRIVAKVDELMAFCDRLKADLTTSRNHQTRLATTLIQSALEAA
jgi:type I restriction enzyme S subunit